MSTVCSNDSTTKNCCGNCERYVRNPKKPGYGWCDEWGGVELSDDVVCHPYLGKSKMGIVGVKPQNGKCPKQYEKKGANNGK